MAPILLKEDWGGALIWLMSGELNITDPNQKEEALIYNFIDGFQNGLK